MTQETCCPQLSGGTGCFAGSSVVCLYLETLSDGWDKEGSIMQHKQVPSPQAEAAAAAGVAARNGRRSAAGALGERDTAASEISLPSFPTYPGAPSTALAEPTTASYTGVCPQKLCMYFRSSFHPAFLSCGATEAAVFRAPGSHRPPCMWCA